MLFTARSVTQPLKLAGTLDKTKKYLRRIPRDPMTDLEFWRLAAPVLDRIKCGHTGLWYPQRLQKEFGSTLPLLPLEVRDLPIVSMFIAIIPTPAALWKAASFSRSMACL